MLRELPAGEAVSPVSGLTVSVNSSWKVAGNESGS